MIAEEQIAPCRAIDLGCGTGINSVWLAQQGFDVTGVDLTALAIERARRRAAEERVAVRFLQADVLDFPPDLESQPGFEPFLFFFDRGGYNSGSEKDVQAKVRTLIRKNGPSSQGGPTSGRGTGGVTSNKPADPALGSEATSIAGSATGIGARVRASQACSSL